MNSLRLSASPWVVTCSAETIVPWMTSRSTPADEHGRRELQRVLRRDADRRRDPGVSHLLDPGGDQVRLAPARSRPPAAATTGGRRRAPASRSRAVDRRRVLVPGPEPLGVEHAEPAGLRRRRSRSSGLITASDGLVTSGMSNRKASICQAVEHVVDVAGTPGRDDRDLVEVVAPPGEPVQTDLDGVACTHVVSGLGSSGLRRSSGCHAGGSRSRPADVIRVSCPRSLQVGDRWPRRRSPSRPAGRRRAGGRPRTSAPR